MLLAFFLISQTLWAGNGGGGFIQIFDGKLKRADRYYDNLEYAPAIKLYEKVLEKNSDLAEVKLKLAESYRKTNDHQNAEKWYSQIIYNSTIIEPIHKYNYAQTLISNGKYSEAQQWMQAYQQETASNGQGNKIVTALNNIESFYADSLSFTLQDLPINSGTSDFSPSYYKDGIVFVSSRKKGAKKFKWDESSFLDLYYAEGTDTSALSNPTEFSGEINSKYHEGPVAFYDQDKKMIFTRSNFHEGSFGTSSDGVNTLQMYSAELNEDSSKWVNIQRLPFSQDDFSFGHPTVSADGQRLYFISDMPGGFGGTDIFMSPRQGDDWGGPQNLGDQINTLGNEMYPFIHDSNTLYFASNGHGGLGGLDVFRKDIDDFNKSVKNLGYPLNSNYDDFGFIVDSEGRNGFISSNRNGNDDIIQVVINRVVIEPLIVDNQSHEPLPGVELKLMTDQGVEETIYPDKDGRVQIETIPGKEYSLLASREGYKDQVIHIEPNADSEDIPLTIPMETENVDNYDAQAENVDKTKVNSLVISDGSQLPLSNTKVTVFADGKEQEVLFTDDNGRIEFDAIKGKDYTLLSKQDNFQDQIKRIPSESIAASAENEVVLAMEQEDLSTFNSTSDPVLFANNQEVKSKIGDNQNQVTINGLVLDRATGQPINDANVKLYENGIEQESTYTIEDGRIQFDALPGKDYMIVANNANYQEQIITIPASSIADEEVQEEIILAMQKTDFDPKPIKAKVTDFESGEVLVDAEIKLFVDDPEEEVNYEIRDGIVTLDAEPGKNYMIIASHPAFKDRFVNISGDSLISQDGNELEIALPMDDQSEVASDISSKDHLTLKGLVNGESDGFPIEDVHLKLFVDGTSEEIGFTNNRGKIDFDFVPGKDYMIMASKENFQDLIYHLPGDAVEGDNHSFELAMRHDPESSRALAMAEAEEPLMENAEVGNDVTESQPLGTNNKNEAFIAEGLQDPIKANATVDNADEDVIDIPTETFADDYPLSQQEDLWEQELRQEPIAAVSENLNEEAQTENRVDDNLLAEEFPTESTADYDATIPATNSLDQEMQPESTSSELLADQTDGIENPVEESINTESLASEYVSDNGVTSPEEDLWAQGSDTEMASSPEQQAEAENLVDDNLLFEEFATESRADYDATLPATNSLDQEMQPESTSSELLADQTDGIENPVEESINTESLASEYVSDNGVTSPEEDLWDQGSETEIPSLQEQQAQTDNLADDNLLAEELPTESRADYDATLPATNSLDQEMQPESTSSELLADQTDGIENPVEESINTESLASEYVSDNGVTSPEEDLWDQGSETEIPSLQEQQAQTDNLADDNLLAEELPTESRADYDATLPATNSLDQEMQPESTSSELLADQTDGIENPVEESINTESLASEYVSDNGVTSPEENLWDQGSETEIPSLQEQQAEAENLVDDNLLFEEFATESRADYDATLPATNSLDQEMQPESTSSELLADQTDGIENPVEESINTESLASEYVSDNGVASPEENLWDQGSETEIPSLQEQQAEAENRVDDNLLVEEFPTESTADYDATIPTTNSLDQEMQPESTSSELLADQTDGIENPVEESIDTKSQVSEYVSDNDVISPEEDLWDQGSDTEVASSPEQQAEAENLVDDNLLAEEFPTEENPLDQEMQPESTSSELLAETDGIENPIEESINTEIH